MPGDFFETTFSKKGVFTMEKHSALLPVLLAIIIVLLGLLQTPVECHAASSVDFQSSISEEIWPSFCQFVLEMGEMASHSYLDFIDVQTIVGKPYTELTADDWKKINTFLNWAYDYCRSNDRVFSATLLRLGFFVKDLDDFLRNMTLFPLSILENVVALNNDGFSAMGTNDSDKITVSDNFVNNVYNLCSDYQKKSDSEIYYIFPSRTFSEFYQMAKDTVNNSALLQEVYDFHLSNPSSILNIVFHNSRSRFYVGKFEINEILYASMNFPIVLSVLGDDDRSPYLFPGGSIAGSGISSQYRSIPDLIYDIPHFSNGIFYFGFVTQNARPVKVYKSKNLYEATLDWSDGCPYDYLLSDSYNGYDASKDYSFSIQGDYLSNCDITNDYSNIVENVVNNNDYSDHSVSNVVNNFYYGEVGTEGNVQTTDDFRADPDVGGGDDSGDSGEGGGSLVPGGNTGGFIAQIEEMGSFFPKLLEKLNVFKQFPSEVGGLLDVGLSWIPPEDRALTTAGIAAFILIGLWKLIWKG